MNALYQFLLASITVIPALSYAQPDLTLSVFEPGVVSLPGIRETSPSLTADGRTLVFARTENWKDKAPYMAKFDGQDWIVERLPFTDTLYNLAITPNGESIYYKKYEVSGDTTISRAYRVDRQEDGWGVPQNLPQLEGINAGYFCPLPNGTLYLFARKPEPGIYYCRPTADGSLGNPKWLSEAVSIPNTTSFDVLMHPREDRLLITRAGIPEGKKDTLGPKGYFFYKKINGKWKEIKRLPLPYGWGATALPDGRLLFVEEGDLQFVYLESLGLDWPGLAE